MSRPTRRIKNLSLAGIAGLAGCATVIIVVVALLLGLWFDGLFNQRGPCVFGLLILSVPVSLYVMLRITLGLLNRIEPQLDNTLLDDLEEN